MNKQMLLASASILASIVATSAFAGDNNSATAFQSSTGETATIDQSGDGNLVGPAANSQTQGIYQTGTGDNLTVTQSGTADTFDGNDATSGSLVQTGSDNSADVNQSGTSSTVHLTQRGANNGTFDENGSPVASAPSSADAISQSANNSTLSLSQNGNSNVFDLVQGGADNTQTVTQQNNSNEVITSQDSATVNSAITINQGRRNGNWLGQLRFGLAGWQHRFHDDSSPKRSSQQSDDVADS